VTETLAQRVGHGFTKDGKWIDELDYIYDRREENVSCRLFQIIE
jgi:hypothetical protein